VSKGFIGCSLKYMCPGRFNVQYLTVTSDKTRHPVAHPIDTRESRWRKNTAGRASRERGAWPRGGFGRQMRLSLKGAGPDA